MKKMSPYAAILSLSLMVFAMLTYRMATADDSSDAPNALMSGTYLIYPETGPPTPLVNPSLRHIGDRAFLHGEVSGKVGDILKDSAFSGKIALVPVDRIASMQRVD